MPAMQDRRFSVVLRVVKNELNIKLVVKVKTNVLVYVIWRENWGSNTTNFSNHSYSGFKESKMFWELCLFAVLLRVGWHHCHIHTIKYEVTASRIRFRLETGALLNVCHWKVAKYWVVLQLSLFCLHYYHWHQRLVGENTSSPIKIFFSWYLCSHCSSEPVVAFLRMRNTMQTCICVCGHFPWHPHE